MLVAEIGVGRSLERVSTTFGDGVDTTANEVGLTYIEGRNDYLHFLDSVERDGASAARQTIAQSEVIVEVSTIDREVRHLSVGTGKAHATAGIWRQLGNIGDATANHRHRHHLFVVDVCRGTSLLACKLRGATADNHLLKVGGILGKPYVEVVGLAQLQGDALQCLCLETDVGHRYGIGAARSHTLNGKASVHVGYRRVACARRFVQHLYGSTDNFFATILNRDLTGHARSSHLCHY